MKKESVKKRPVLLFFGYMVLLAFLGYVAYSVHYYLTNVESFEEYQVCFEDKCIKTFHMHSDINIFLCDELVLLPLEHGSLAGPHTHKERNLIHYHERLPYDPVSKKLLDTRPLVLGSFMQAMDIRFDSNCVGKYCNGDPCPDGKIGTVRMSVNGVPSAEFERFVWKDGDDIKIVFN